MFIIIGQNILSKDGMSSCCYYTIPKYITVLQMFGRVMLFLNSIDLHDYHSYELLEES